ncbi:MAG TPA: hypothetical protein VGY57_13155, partial [Vicinamibacterales bacterium]|nr:hypothetical protein [Vicinamibacterales bacterium]
MTATIRAACVTCLFALTVSIVGHAQGPSVPSVQTARSPRAALPMSDVSPDGDTAWGAQFESLSRASIRLPIAAVLSAILAFRPRRRGTPKRQAPVIQTQIILAVVGATVMLVVGASLARAFGI